MNELQVKITADISQFQSAIGAAESRLKKAESVLLGARVSADKYNQALAKLSGELKRGSISQADFDKKADQLSTGLRKQQEIINTSTREVSRLNKEFDRIRVQAPVSNAIGNTSAKFAGLTGNIKGSNSVAIEFNRFIQDAPFGLIGIGNNLQQLATNFSNVAKTAGGTGAAIKASLASIISPVNLGLLAVSALTAGFTAYQMGAFDFVTATDEAKTAQEEFNESLKDTEQTLKQGFFNELLKAQGLLKQENLGGRLVDVPAFQTADEVLQKLAGTIDGLNKNELEALESFLSQRLADAARAASNATTELEKSLANTDVTGYQEVLTKVNEQLKFYETDTKKSTKATKELKQEISSFSTDPLVDAYFEAIRAGAEYRKSLEQAASGLTGNEGEDPATDVQNKITQALLQSGPPVNEFAETLKNQAKEIVDANAIIGDSFSALGTIIGANLETSNKALNGFIRVVLSSAPKIIQAILAQAAAKKVADAQIVSSNVQVAASEGIAVGAKAANALGPVGLALLPVFIGGALAIISGAFSSIGKGGVGGGGGGSIPASGRPPQIFTNANTVTPPSPNIPSPSGSIDFDKAQGRLDARVSGEDIVFVYDRYKERQKGGG